MTRFLLRRLGYSAITILLATVIVFALSRMSGDPRLLYLNNFSHVGPEIWEAWGVKLGLDKPTSTTVSDLAARYRLNRRLGRVNRHIRTGVGFRNRETAPYAETNGRRVHISPSWSAYPLGVLSGVYRGTVWDYTGQDDGCSGSVCAGLLAGDRSDSHLLR